MTDDTTKPIGEAGAPGAASASAPSPEATAATVPLTPPPARSPGSEPVPGAAAASASAASAVARGPRIRWAGIIWGLVFAAIAAFLLAVLGDAERLDAAMTWWAQLTPGALVLVLAVALGALLLVGGLASLARRAAR